MTAPQNSIRRRGPHPLTLSDPFDGESFSMAQTLVIAEKPSVAGDIARALGGFKKDGDFWVSDGMLIGSALHKS